MVPEDSKNWRDKYVPGKTTLALAIPCNTISFVHLEHNDFNYCDYTNIRPIGEWIDSMVQIKGLIDSDINNVENCLNYLTTKYPHVKIIPGYYGIEIRGLSETEIFDCIQVDNLMFDIFVDNILP
jgi:hypothetical protein